MQIEMELMKAWQSKKWLVKQYVDKERTAEDIGKEVGCTGKNVTYWLKKHDIPLRSYSETLTNLNKKKRNEEWHPWYDYDWLYNQYVDQCKSPREIANEFGTTENMIGNWLEILCIPRRSKEEALTTYYSKRNFNSVDAPYHNEEWLYEQYITNKKSTTQLANELGCSSDTISHWLREFNIQTRNHSDRVFGREYPCGSASPGWKGGISKKRYCRLFNYEFKEHIRNKFDRKCFICGNPEYKHKHSVHHVDYNKNSICNKKTWPFVPLCRSHHAMTGENRWYWFNLLMYFWTMNDEICFQKFPFRNEIYV